MSLYYVEPSIRYGELYASFAQDFRDIAFEIDADPECIFKHLDLPAVDFILSDRDSTAVARTAYLEAFGYGDAGVLLACPGPSLSGLMLRELGLPDQIDLFYSMLKTQKMRTFFALSEPEKGSDANYIQTRLQKNSRVRGSYRLNGVKSFFGNGAVANQGIVLAKIAEGPVGIRAVWLMPEILSNNDSILRQTLPMFSLRGAQIAIMSFHDTVVPQECILGEHLSACENGLLGIIKVFNRLRTGVGALAIGQAQGVYDLTFQLKQKNFLSLKSEFADINHQLISARQLLQKAAAIVDENPLASQSVSLAKMNATETAEKVISRCIDLCTMDQLIENPWLTKAYRDVFCWEYMEGTSNIQKKEISKNLPQIVNQMKH